VVTGAGSTRTVSVALAPSARASRSAVPGATPTTRPALVTLATPGAALVHVTARSGSGVPSSAWGVAPSCRGSPTRSVTSPPPGSSTSVATGTATTRTLALPRCPSGVLAVRVAVPGASARTVPVLSTVATAGALEA
jgi:hypothetical protein